MKSTHSKHVSVLYNNADDVTCDPKPSSLKLQSEKHISRWQGSISIFNGLTNTKPVKERKNLPWGGISAEVCPPRPLITKDKAQGQQYISCLLKEEPLIGKTLEEAQKSGGQTIGKMRSRNHVTESSFLTLEFDGIPEADFIAGLEKLKKNAFTYKAWTTFSFGDPDRPGMYARIVIPIDRILAVDEYTQAFNGLNEHFFDGKADPSGAKLYQPQGVRCCHSSRVEQSKTWENFRDLASAEALIQIGRSLQSLKEIRPAQSNPVEPDDEKLAKLKKLLKSIDPDVGYSDWSIILMVIFNETGGSDAGLELADDWSSKGEKYKGLGEIESKWKSFDLNHENPVTIATLYKMVKDGEKNWKIICDAVTPEFKVLDFETETINSSAPSKIEHVLNSNIETLASEQKTISSHPSISSTDANVIITSLAAMSPLEYDRIRLEKAKELGVQVKTLDAQVKELRNKKTDDNNQVFPEIEPYAEPIDLALLLDEISEVIRRFVIVEKEQADAAALWIADTYLIDIFDVSPIAIINAPEKECAKTLFQTLLARMAFRALPAANASVSALFRAVELWKPTIFFDEADTFFRNNLELQGLVNAGYKRGGYVLRSESTGDSFEPRRFSVYSAKSIAGISLEKHLSDATMSRGIIFNMRRKLPHESVMRLRQAESGMFEIIASKLTRFATDYAQQVRLAQPKLPDELSDRDQDNWEPLLAIAECAGPEWLRRATAAALALSSAGEAFVSTSNELLEDIQRIFESKGVEKISTADLITALIADEESAWATYNRGKPISPRQLAKLLAGYGIKSKTVRLGHANTPKGYDKGQFEDTFARYLGEKLPQQCNDSPEPKNDKAVGVADNTQRFCNDYLALESLSGDRDGDADK